MYNEFEEAIENIDPAPNKQHRLQISIDIMKTTIAKSKDGEETMYLNQRLELLEEMMGNLQREDNLNPTPIIQTHLQTLNLTLPDVSL